MCSRAVLTPEGFVQTFFLSVRLWHGGCASSRKIIIGGLLLAGDSRGGGPPGSIPNPEVKPTSADDTASAGTWESRSWPAKSSWSVSINKISVVI